ncbi:vitelline membrane outer layer protein 1 homolog [Discoglossus pictus]
MIYLALLTFLLQYLFSAGNEQSSPRAISVTNGATWGSWGPVRWCPFGYKARGFSVKVEGSQRKGDDTALNGIRLHCVSTTNNNQEHKIISSDEGPWGSWSSPFWCLDSFPTSFALRVEPPQGRGDDTAANNIMFKCSNNHHLEGSGLSWGTYGPWSLSCIYGICGIQTSVESSQGKGDDTALNDVQFSCCSN